MITSFELNLNGARSEFILSLFCQSSLVSELYFDSIKHIEVNCYPCIEGLQYWLQPSSLNRFVNVDIILNRDCAEALYNLIQDFPIPFTSYKFEVNHD